MEDKKTIEGEVVETTPSALTPVAAPMAMMSTSEVRAAVTAMTEIRSVLDDYIRANLVESVDYGPAFPGSSKKTLLKPGSEKMSQLFNLRAEFTRDDLVREMAGNPEKAYFFICRLMDRQGNVWGEGRGACAEDMARKRDANSAIKIGQKRAQMDVTLRVFALSDRFTQDMEDGDYAPTPAPVQTRPAGNYATAPTAAAQAPKPAAPAAPRPASEKQLAMIHALCRESGLDVEKLNEWTTTQFKKRVSELTSAEASATIDKLQKRSVGEGKPPAQPPAAPSEAAALDEVAKSAWKPEPVAQNSVNVLTAFMKRIEAATPEQLSDIEGEIQLDVTMNDTARKTLMSMLQARKSKKA